MGITTIDGCASGSEAERAEVDERMEFTSTRISKDDWSVVAPKGDVQTARPRPALIGMIGAALLAIGTALGWERVDAAGVLHATPVTGLELPDGMVILASAWACTLFVLWGLRRTRVVFHCFGAALALVGLGVAVDAAVRTFERAGSVARAIGSGDGLAIGLPLCVAGGLIAVAGAVQAARGAAATLPGRR